MKIGRVTLWGFAATAALTTVLNAGQETGLTRLDLPYILGTMLTPDRDRARAVGFAAHLLNGWIFASAYVAAFESWRRATWWRGAAIGLLHGAFLLGPGMAVLPSLHPRMASEESGPTATRQLEPPGFCGLNYGGWTPACVLAAHALYGAVLGAFYRA